MRPISSRTGMSGSSPKQQVVLRILRTLASPDAEWCPFDMLGGLPLQGLARLPGVTRL